MEGVAPPGLTVQLVLREAGPAQVPHGVQGYGVRGGGEAEGAGGRQQTEDVSTHTPLHRDPDGGGGLGETGSLAAHMQRERTFQIPE